jgi:HAE1 family hydrophobic/amphiphilic exporter-1
MNCLTRFALKNASAIIILCILIIIGGTYSGLKLKKEEMPDMTFPVVAVITVYPGAAPNDIQDKITKPFENLVNNVEGIKHVNSISSENISAIIVQFDFSADMDEAQRKVEAALKNATIPDGAIAPKVSRFNFNSMPMLRVSISNENVSPQDLEQKVRDDILPGLSSINGVAQVELASDSQKSVYVKLLPEKLKEYNLTYQGVVQMLQANNVAFPTGSVSINDTVEPIRVSGKFNSLDELKNMQIPIVPSTQETLKSVNVLNNLARVPTFVILAIPFFIL